MSGCDVEALARDIGDLAREIRNSGGQPEVVSIPKLTWERLLRYKAQCLRRAERRWRHAARMARKRRRGWA